MEDLTFPRVIKMDNAGIYYLEQGPNAIFINVVSNAEAGEISLVATLDQNSLGNNFSSMSFGKVEFTIPLLDLLMAVQKFADGVVLPQKE